jgi:uncharacterized protein YbjT (DUF2867 family)
MRRLSILAVAAFVLFGSAAAAQAQEKEIDCGGFIKNTDGSWTVVADKVYLPVQKIRVNKGVTFTSDQLFLGEDMVARLNKACPNVQPQPDDAEAAPASAAVGAPGSASQAPRVQLSQYADPSGELDVRRLTCAHVDAASPEEADVLLSWYSGWYAAAAKRRGANISFARVRDAVRSVRDYCRTNGDKNLSQVMELMLK